MQRPTMYLFGVALILMGCRADNVKVNSDTVEEVSDLDGDGFTEEAGDCDDNNAAINANAVEICDGLDNNCNGEIDEGVTNTYYFDNDNDGFGNDDVTTEACSTPDGYVLTKNDCNDDNPDIFPGSELQCDKANTTLCASGGIVEGETVRGVFCFAPSDIGTAPKSSGESITWQPGPMNQITTPSN